MFIHFLPLIIILALFGASLSFILRSHTQTDVCRSRSHLLSPLSAISLRIATDDQDLAQSANVLSVAMYSAPQGSGSLTPQYKVYP